jgi:hypothetical protein
MRWYRSAASALVPRREETDEGDIDADPRALMRSASAVCDRPRCGWDWDWGLDCDILDCDWAAGCALEASAGRYRTGDMLKILLRTSVRSYSVRSWIRRARSSLGDRAATADLRCEETDAEAAIEERRGRRPASSLSSSSSWTLPYSKSSRLLVPSTWRPPSAYLVPLPRP